MHRHQATTSESCVTGHTGAYSLNVAKLRRDEWIEAGLVALADGGVAALSVEPLATRLEVTKGSFYHHFADRRALHLAVLDAWEERGTNQIIHEVEQRTADPNEQLRRLFRRTTAPNPESDALENAIRSWAAQDEVAAAAVRRVDARREEYVATLLRAIGLPRGVAAGRARLFYRVLIGEFQSRASGAAPLTRRDVDEALTLLVST
jgi:AcrR family transcriptional regulator